MTAMAARLATLNKEQQDAVRCTEGPLLILAGAGSGKTRVLTHRIAYLIENQVHPRHILAITFTNKAAREMKTRIEQLVPLPTTAMWVLTFHAMCVRVLRRDIDRLGYSSSFTILDGSDQLSVIKSCMKDLNIDAKQLEPRSVLGAISAAKNELCDSRAFAKKNTNYAQQRISLLYTEYEKRLRANQSVDFDDLIALTIMLFEQHPDVLHTYQQLFRYIHVDEYQDTNTAQYRLCHLLASGHHNICVVGDADQSIYGWRGADIGNILNFMRDYPAAQRIILEQNYRSTANILHAANAVIQHNSDRTPKTLRTNQAAGKKIQRYEAFNEEDEVAFLIDHIQAHIRQQQHTYADHAILYRTNAQSRIVEDGLRSAGIPYQMVGGIKFYDRKEIKDIIAYLRLIANPDDDLAFERIINVPRRGIGDTTLEKLREAATVHGVSLFAMMGKIGLVAVQAKMLATLTTLYRQIKTLHEQGSLRSVTELTKKILADTGYRDALLHENTLESKSRLENIDEFLSVTMKFDKSYEEPLLTTFLSELALVADIDALETAETTAPEAVVLMTLHSAKGLEFPVVFMVGMEENIFPSSRSVSSSQLLEEERRLAYVGITRAQQLLCMTSAQSRLLYGQKMFNRPSRFLDEIPAPYIEKAYRMTLKRSPSPALTRTAVTPSTSSPDKPQNSSFVGGNVAHLSLIVGDRVHHTTFLEGVVQAIEGEGTQRTLTIAFGAPYGTKKLLASYAPLRKV